MGRIMTSIILIIYLLFSPTGKVSSGEEDLSMILQIDGNPYTYKHILEKNYPTVQIIEVFDTLFNGLAIKTSLKDFKRLLTETFVTAFFHVNTYQVDTVKSYLTTMNEPKTINSTTFTGKGVKVAVIDTGIDYSHPDLAMNYKGGYDLIDLDEDPMETLPEEGMPTVHGTHVAGIIAAKGEVEGVAKDAEIYAYRALGPGGQGTTIQVIAALEQAVKDQVDIINLSLGNSVNGPDFPTSLAVNKAVELGFAVVIASGNDGPDEWTVGSPATATKALSVGAKQTKRKIPYLYESLERKKIPIHRLPGSGSWDLTRDYELIRSNQIETTNLRGKIILLSTMNEIENLPLQVEEKEAIALLIPEDILKEFLQSYSPEHFSIPVAAVPKEEGQWITKKLTEGKLFLQTIYEYEDETIASFSSKGPVTRNWAIKPEIIAPGTDIVSTVPGGYEVFDGTSMAAPHVAGALAVLKEANPHWTNQQIVQALQTTAKPLTNKKDEKLPPTSQGMGEIQIEKALEAKILIDNPLLSFGRITSFKEENTMEITVENISKQDQTLHFQIPKKKRGITWKVPRKVTVKSMEKKEISLQISVTTSLLDEGIHQDWLTFTLEGEEYSLPYLFINQEDDYQKVMGFHVAENPFTKGIYEYQFYTTEPLATLRVELFHPSTLLHEETFLHLEGIDEGLIEDEVKKTKEIPPGEYIAVITIVTESGEANSYEMKVAF